MMEAPPWVQDELLTEPIERFAGEHRWLSNFWPAPVEYNGIGFPTVEHAYQAAKTQVQAMQQFISQLPTPNLAKSWGRRVVMRPDWGDAKIHVMRHLLRQKFAIKELKEKLLATGDRQLVEGNTWGDTFWGVYNHVGENNLGLLLMEIREELRD